MPGSSLKDLKYYIGELRLPTHSAPAPGPAEFRPHLPPLPAPSYPSSRGIRITYTVIPPPHP